MPVNNDMQPNFKTAAELLEAVMTVPITEVMLPIDVESIARKLNIRMNYEMYIGSDILGSIAIVDGKAEITVNTCENSYQPRKRFTIAHEIAHYCLHLNSSASKFIDTRKTMDRNGSYWQPAETEANHFAAELLMPKELIIKYADIVIHNYCVDYGADKMPTQVFVEYMAKLFNVSLQAMEIRLKGMKFFS